ncbi:MAG: glutaredoxin family protein [Usitatibacter sp.]
MKSTQIALAILAAAFIARADAQTTVYKWTDKDGKVHFSDTLPDSNVNATQKTMGGGDAQNSNLPVATQMAMQRNPVTLYASSDCGGSCTTARDLLEKRGVPYTERDPQKNAGDQDALKKLVGALYVPVLVVGSGTPMKGYQEDDWNAALDSAGYPRTRLPGEGSMRRQPSQSSEAATK